MLNQEKNSLKDLIVLIQAEERAKKNIFVEYHDSFARHRMDIRMKREFKLKPTSKDDKAVYKQSLPIPIHLKEHLIIKLALTNKSKIITMYPFPSMQVEFLLNKHPRKTTYPCRTKDDLHFDFRRLHSKYSSSSTLLEAAQNLAGKSFFCKLDCSQAGLFFRWWTKSQCQCLHSILLAEHLHAEDWNKVLADLCLLLHDNGIVVNNVTGHNRNTQAIFKSNRKAGLKLVIEKCHFTVRQVGFLGRTI